MNPEKTLKKLTKLEQKIHKRPEQKEALAKGQTFLVYLMLGAALLFIANEYYIYSIPLAQYLLRTFIGLGLLWVIYFVLRIIQKINTNKLLSKYERVIEWCVENKVELPKTKHRKRRKKNKSKAVI